jgi:hypothetical protein
MTLEELMPLIRVTEDGHWEWLGKIDAAGRLIYRSGSRSCKDANRIVYALTNGCEPPVKLTKTCDNPKCVRHWEGSAKSKEPAPLPPRRETDLAPEEVAAFVECWNKGVKAPRLMQRFNLTACALSRLVCLAQGGSTP